MAEYVYKHHSSFYKRNTLYLNIIFLFLLLFNYSCPHFPPTAVPHPTHLPLPTLNPTHPLALSMGPLYIFLDYPSPLNINLGKYET